MEQIKDIKIKEDKTYIKFSYRTQQYQTIIYKWEFFKDENNKQKLEQVKKNLNNYINQDINKFNNVLSNIPNELYKIK